jgi:HEAT repeat protein
MILDRSNRWLPLLVVALLTPAVHADGQTAEREAKREAARHEAERETAERDLRRAEREIEQAEAALTAAERAYARGHEMLDRSRYLEAAELFEQALATESSQPDGALYWKAYALYRQAEFRSAFAELRRLRASYPSSRWLKQARSLEAEMSGSEDPDSANGDLQVKLVAIASLMRHDPERAMPYLDKLLDGDHAPELKAQALFLLIQSDRPGAFERLADVALDDSEPELQMHALEHIGMIGGERGLGLLARVYDSSDSVEVRGVALQGLAHAGDRQRVLAAARGESSEELRERAIHFLGSMGEVDELARLYAVEKAARLKMAILDGFAMAGEKSHILRAAREESSEELRRHAIHMLGALGGGDELWTMFERESSEPIKVTILEALAMTGKVERMAQVARGAEATAVREAAIHGLGMAGAERSRELFRSLYADESDRGIKLALIHGMAMSGDAEGLIGIARREKDPGLRTEAVRWLSELDSPEATAFMIEILEQD